MVLTAEFTATGAWLCGSTLRAAVLDEERSALSPANDAVYEYVPGGNVLAGATTCASPFVSVVVDCVDTTVPPEFFIVNTTVRPDSEPVGTVTLVRTAESDIDALSKPDAGAVLTEVTTAETVADAEEVSAIRLPVWSAKKPAKLVNEAVTGKLPAFGKVTVTVAKPLISVVADWSGITPLKEKLTIWPAFGAPPGAVSRVAVKVFGSPATALIAESDIIVR